MSCPAAEAEAEAEARCRRPLEDDEDPGWGPVEGPEPMEQEEEAGGPRKKWLEG